MSYIIEFYKNLDTINLIIFWGVIIVILLLLIFSIILANKNKKLERILENKEIDEEESIDDLAIKKTEDSSSNKVIIDKSIEERTIYQESQNHERAIPEEISPAKEAIIATAESSKNDEETIKKEKFIAEEHVKEYNNDFFEIPNIKKQSESENEIHKVVMPEKTKITIKEESISNHQETPKPYQRNILREVYPTQTSPIGAIKEDSITRSKVEEARELNEALNSEKNQSHIEEIRKYPTREHIVEEKKIQISTFPETHKRGNYLEELSKKMSQTNNENDLNRTSYELQQEEDAIISYRELMQKKDQIQTVDEEDAVISIEELQRRKKAEEKLYNITEKEADDDFINELKHFRSDL